MYASVQSELQIARGNTGAFFPHCVNYYSGMRSVSPGNSIVRYTADALYMYCRLCRCISPSNSLCCMKLSLCQQEFWFAMNRRWPFRRLSLPRMKPLGRSIRKSIGCISGSFSHDSLHDCLLIVDGWKT